MFQTLDDLKSEVENFSPPKQVQVPQTRILVIGPVGAGKSSFFNTVASIFRGRVTRQASSGSAENSITSQVSWDFQKYIKLCTVKQKRQ